MAEERTLGLARARESGDEEPPKKSFSAGWKKREIQLQTR